MAAASGNDNSITPTAQLALGWSVFSQRSRLQRSAFGHHVVLVGHIYHLGFRYNVILVIGPRTHFLCPPMPVI
jgi:hypothetical protein